MADYSRENITRITNEIVERVRFEITNAFLTDCVEELCDKYGVSIEKDDMQIGITKRMKILVLGDLAGKKEDFKNKAKTIGIDSSNLDFKNYNEAKVLDLVKLQYSNEYSDVICGPIPHKIKGMGDVSCAIVEIEKNASIYPKLVMASANGTLKISITCFLKCLLKTRFYKAIVEGF